MKNDAKVFTKGPYSRYKGKYLIAFYDKTGEDFIAIFNNIRELLQYKKLDVTRENVQTYARYIYYAINQNNHNTRLLDGSTMTVWLVPDDESDDIH